MKRARGKNSKGNLQKERNYSHENIDVPEMIRERNRSQNTATKKRPNVKKKKKKKHTKLKVLLIIILAVVAAFVFLMGRSISGGDAEGALVPVDMEKGKLNVLLLGVDKEGMRTDAIMLVSYDLKNPGAKVLSIPRDTQIKVADRKVTRKITEVHAMHDEDGNLIGPMGSVRAVGALTNIPIHYYVELNFDAIDELADIIGPIEFDVPDLEGNGRGMNYDDPVQDLHIHLKPGLQELSGNQVQQFLRYRKSNNGTIDGSDISRVERQQEFLKAAIEQKVNMGLIAKVPSIYSKLRKNMKTNFSVGDAVKYAKYLQGLTSDGLKSYSLPGESKRLVAWYFICDLDKTAELIESEFDYLAEDITNVINLGDVKGTKKALTNSNTKTEWQTNESKNDKSDENDGTKDKTIKPETSSEELEEEAGEFSDYDEYEQKTQTAKPSEDNRDDNPPATQKPSKPDTVEETAPEDNTPQQSTQEPAADDDGDEYISLD